MQNQESRTIRIEFGKAISKYRINSFDSKLSQTDLCDRIKKTNASYIVTQRQMSRIENGQVAFLEVELVEIISGLCEIDPKISIPMIELMKRKSGVYDKDTLVNISAFESIITDPKKKEIKPFLGDYHFCYYSTDPEQRKIVKGKIKLQPDVKNSKCLAFFEILNDDSNIIKRYTGQFFLNNYYNTTYCILTEDRFQEVCFIISNRFNPSHDNNKINVSLVLTTAAGRNKIPTAHKMIISRKEPSNSAMKLLQGYMKLNSEEFYVSKTELDELEAILQNDLCDNIKYRKELLTAIEYIKTNCEPQTYYRINDKIIHDGLWSKRNDIDGIIATYVTAYLKKYIKSSFHEKITKEIQNICLDILEEY